jgi:hypothetical protein
MRHPPALMRGFPPGGQASRTNRRVILWMRTIRIGQWRSFAQAGRSFSLVWNRPSPAWLLRFCCSEVRRAPSGPGFPRAATRPANPALTLRHHGTSPICSMPSSAVRRSSSSAAAIRSRRSAPPIAALAPTCARPAQAPDQSRHPGEGRPEETPPRSPSPRPPTGSLPPSTPPRSAR